MQCRTEEAKNDEDYFMRPSSSSESVGSDEVLKTKKMIERMEACYTNYNYIKKE